MVELEGDSVPVDNLVGKVLPHKGDLLIAPHCFHQEKLTVPFTTIDHYISLFVTFVAISAIIALWHP